MSKLHQIQKAMEMIGLQPGAGAPNAPKSLEEAQRKTYQFWDTQPVPKLSKCFIKRKTTINIYEI